MIWALLVIIAAGVLLLGVVSGASRPKLTKPGRRVGGVDPSLVRSRWEMIEQMAGNGGVGLKGAITEADKLLDYVMRQQGTPGNTMAERLKRVQTKLRNREAVWQAHKLRNHLNHEVTFDLVPSQARQAVSAYGQALRDLGALK